MLRSIRLTLKLHRFEVGAAALAALVLGVAALLVNERLLAVHVPAGCFQQWLSAGPDQAGDCYGPVNAFATINESEAGKVFAAMAVLPFLVGLLGSVPLVGRELEARTAQTAWSLSGSRLRWLARQVAPVLVLLGVVVTFAALAADRLEATRQPWLNTAVNDMTLHGPIVLGRALAGFCVGLLLGAVMGRTLPAFIVGVALVLALDYGASLAHQAWIQTRPAIVIGDQNSNLVAAVQTNQGWRAPDGSILNEEAALALVPPGVAPQESSDQWLGDRGYELVALGIPQSEALQWILYDIALFGSVGFVGLVGAAIVVNRRRPT